MSGTHLNVEVQYIVGMYVLKTLTDLSDEVDALCFCQLVAFLYDMFQQIRTRDTAKHYSKKTSPWQKQVTSYLHENFLQDVWD